MYSYPEYTQFVNDARVKKQATYFYDLHSNSNKYNECWMLNEWIRSVSQSIYYARLFQKIWTNWIKIALIFLLPFSSHWFTFFASSSFSSHAWSPQFIFVSFPKIWFTAIWIRYMIISCCCYLLQKEIHLIFTK